MASSSIIMLPCLQPSHVVCTWFPRIVKQSLSYVYTCMATWPVEDIFDIGHRWGGGGGGGGLFCSELDCATSPQSYGHAYFVKAKPIWHC